MYQFQYTLNDNDYLEFNRYHLFNAPANKKILPMLRLTVPLLLFAMIMLSGLFEADQESIVIQLVVYVAASILWFFAAKPFYFYIMKRGIQSLKKHGKLPYSNNVSLRFDEDDITEITPDTEVKIKYSKIERIVADKAALYIYIGTVQALILPFAAFESIEQREAFRAFIHQKAVITGA